MSTADDILNAPLEPDKPASGVIDDVDLAPISAPMSMTTCIRVAMMFGPCSNRGVCYWNASKTCVKESRCVGSPPK